MEIKIDTRFVYNSSGAIWAVVDITEYITLVQRVDSPTKQVIQLKHTEIKSMLEKQLIRILE